MSDIVKVDETLNELRKAQELSEAVFKNKDYYEGFKEGINTAIDLIKGSECPSEISDIEPDYDAAMADVEGAAAEDAEVERILNMTEEELIAEAGGREEYDRQAAETKRAVDYAMVRFHITKVLADNRVYLKLSKPIAEAIKPYLRTPVRESVGQRLVIIESPYAGDIETNVEYARKCVRDSLLRGEAPIASHLLYTQPGVLKDEIPEERQQGIDAGLAWRKVAQATVVYADLGISKGMQYGIDAASTAGIPVEYRSLK